MFRWFKKPDTTVNKWKIEGGAITMERRGNIIDITIFNDDDTKIRATLAIYELNKLKNKKAFAHTISETNNIETLDNHDTPQQWLTKIIKKNKIIKYSETAAHGFIFSSNGHAEADLQRLFFNGNRVMLKDIDYFTCPPYIYKEPVARPSSSS